MKSLTPLLSVQDMVESLNFYEVLGFDLEQQMPEEGVPDLAAEGLAEFLRTDPDGHRLVFFLDEV
jgi:hypothetical protein